MTDGWESMEQDALPGYDRTQIEAAQRRSQMYGLTAQSTPDLDPRPVEDGAVRRAASVVLRRFAREYSDVPMVLAMGDSDAWLVDVRFTQPSVGQDLKRVRLLPGVCLAEDIVGTNAIGTVLETRQPVLVQGDDHFLTMFQGFTCFGHPVIHPSTRRLVGVVNVGGPSSVDHRFFGPIARQVSREIEQRLALDADGAAQRLMEAFQTVARRPGKPLMAMADDLVLADASAFDLIDPVGHATFTAVPEDADPDEKHRITLRSGRELTFRRLPELSEEATLVELDVVEPATGAPARARPAHRAPASPMLIVGEPGTGRTTEALSVAGEDAALIDIAAGGLTTRGVEEALLHGEGTVVVDDVHLLDDAAKARLAALVTRSPRRIVLTTATNCGNDGVPADVLSGVCVSQRTLVPLRRRRHEIPRIAAAMLEEVSAGRDLRLSADALRVLAAQRWPGNLAELRRVVNDVAQVRSVGDLLASDLPASHRVSNYRLTPIQDAERDVIVTAIESARGNKAKAAKALGVSRSTLYNRIRALQIV